MEDIKDQQARVLFGGERSNISPNLILDLKIMPNIYSIKTREAQIDWCE